MTTAALDLQPFQNAAGHGGVLQDAEGEIVVKPCTQAEIDFYQETLRIHPEFAAFMPTYMGTLKLGDHTADVNTDLQAQPADAQPSKGKKIDTDTAIVLENIEYGYDKPNVVDLKLGSRLYAPGTEPVKAARLDKVASETTTGSLNFRVAGMKVWNTQSSMYDIFDKQYGRRFAADNVVEAFETFFTVIRGSEYATKLLEEILTALTNVRASLEATSSRFYSASILLVFEGDRHALDALVQTQSHNQLDSNHSETINSTISASGGTGGPGGGERHEDEDDDDDDEPDFQPPFRLKVIDFAHSTWHTGQGPDENVIIGLRNIEKQLSTLIAKHKPD